jgi:A/G-specific adenine glycosylase
LTQIDPKSAKIFKHFPASSLQSMTQALLDWYLPQRVPHPWRVLWESKRSPWSVWVSEVMLQQTVIAAVTPKYTQFMERFPTVESFAKADEESIRPFVSGLGYYRRFALLHKGSNLVSKSGFPRSRKEWLGVAGVGAYTSAALASITLDEPVGVVDGNVERVLARVFNIKEVVATNSWKAVFSTFMSKLTEFGKPGDVNQAVMELGQTLCRIKSPRCDQCPVSMSCQAFLQGTQSECPKPKPAKEFVNLSLVATCHSDGDRIFLVKRNEDSLFLKGTIGFPFKEGQKKLLPSTPSIKHSITKYKITASLFHSPSAPKAEGLWVKRSELNNFLLTSLDQKIWRLAQKKLKPISSK